MIYISINQIINPNNPIFQWKHFMPNFRYILVKYADRGLVVKGRISPLFQQLYLTATLSASLMYYSIALSRHFQSDKGEEDTPLLLRKTLHSFNEFISLLKRNIVSCQHDLIINIWNDINVLTSKLIWLPSNCMN